MDPHGFQQKLALAESTQTRDSCTELLRYVRKEKLRESRAVSRTGKLLVTKHRRGLGDEGKCVKTYDTNIIFTCFNAINVLIFFCCIP